MAVKFPPYHKTLLAAFNYTLLSVLQGRDARRRGWMEMRMDEKRKNGLGEENKCIWEEYACKDNGWISQQGRADGKIKAKKNKKESKNEN